MAIKITGFYQLPHQTMPELVDFNEVFDTSFMRKYTRFHPRCGTSFLILVVIVSVFLYSVLPWGSIGLRVLFKLLLLPLVMGISYELLKWCGRSDNIATRIIRQPGIWVQHLTVFEPDDSMIEVAIAAVTPVLPEDPEDGRW